MHEPLQRDYVEVSTSSYQRAIESHRRWRICLWTGLGCTLITCAILLSLLIVGARQPRLAFPVAEVGDSPLLALSFPIKERSHPKGRSNFTIRPEMVYESMTEAREEFRNRKTLEEQLLNHQLNRSDLTPSSYHQQVTTLSPEMRNFSDSAVLAETSVRLLLEREQIPIAELQSADPSALLKEWVHCDPTLVNKKCRPEDKFRTLDGTCNNLHAPEKGATMQPFRRILPPVYDDGFSSPRTKSVVGSDQPLLSAREVSRRFTDSADHVAVETKLSMLFLTWGQFLDHDMTNTGSSKGENGSAITCCGQRKQHPECFPIHVENNDPFYADKGVRCLDFVRSAPAPQCKINGREQFNQASAFIDGSMIYATTSLEADIRLRAHVNGNMRGRLFQDGRWMLPISDKPNDGCNKDELIKQSRYCFKAGDVRVNEQIGLTAMHTVWMREHNRIANELADMNKHWDDTRTYEEARRIVIAMVQHISYNEFVPLLLGEKLTEHLKLRPLASDYDSSYDKEVDAGISNEFSTAAYRFGHSMLQGLVEFHTAKGRTIDFMQFTKILFNPFALWDFGKLDAVVRGNAQQCPRKLDTSFSTQVTNHLFQPEKSNHGFDLFALNIQRGRDHGLAPYIQWRELCNLSPVNDWLELEKEMRPSSFVVLKQIYQDIKDIDLYVGILAENSLPDGILGPVGSCIIGDQFLRSKIGDRFWYETSDPTIRFTPDQLSEIRKSSLARVLCDNGDAMDAIQLKSMEVVSGSNPVKRCHGDEIPRMDLSNWEDGMISPFV
ncbi:peroxidase-like [Daphnia pulicaria]|uniref:peroxidase-like n=1 Tax=Daphnia pulicaria TaxID=35523 RepID=UPI001EEBDBA8|nr:peroxidase-like [Daphnia pulicaria]